MLVLAILLWPLQFFEAGNSDSNSPRTKWSEEGVGGDEAREHPEDDGRQHRVQASARLQVRLIRTSNPKIKTYKGAKQDTLTIMRV